MLIPARFPSKSIKGPPLLPGFIEVSVWIRSYDVTPWVDSIDRPKAETTSTVTVGPPGNAKAFPIAITQSPARRGPF